MSQRFFYPIEALQHFSAQMGICVQDVLLALFERADLIVHRRELLVRHKRAGRMPQSIVVLLMLHALPPAKHKIEDDHEQQDAKHVAHEPAPAIFHDPLSRLRAHSAHRSCVAAFTSRVVRSSSATPIA